MEKQLIRGKKNREDRQFDKTQLKSTQHGQIISRDYAAHFFRWGWVSRQIKHGDSILDVGCGQEQPLARVLAGRIGGEREKYVGIDLNVIKKPFNAKWITIIDQFNFVERYKELENYTLKGFNHIVCFEVIEHMHQNDGKKLLKGIYKLLKSDGTLYLSTPVFNGKAARNHLHEYGIEELHDVLCSVGFTVKNRIGTFASKHDIYKKLNSKEIWVWNCLSNWFGNDVLSTIFAYNYPACSRNNVWICTK